MIIYPGKYQVHSITTNRLLKLIPFFSHLNPGTALGVPEEYGGQLWQFRAGYCLGYAVKSGIRTVGIAAVFRDLGPDPHLPYKSVAQMEFTAVEPGYPGAACALYQHIKFDLRRRGAEAVLITRMVSATEFRTRVHRL